MNTATLARENLKTFDESDEHTWPGAEEFPDGRKPMSAPITVDKVAAVLIYSGTGLTIHDEEGAFFDFVAPEGEADVMLRRLGAAVDSMELFAMGWTGHNGAEFDGQDDEKHARRLERLTVMLEAARQFRQSIAPSIHVNSITIENDRDGSLGALKVVAKIRTQSDACPWIERAVEISKRDAQPLWRVAFEGTVDGVFYVGHPGQGGTIAIAFV